MKSFTQLRRLLIMLIAIFFTSSSLFAQVAINTDGSSPDGSAMLDVKSADKGLLIPRLTTVARNTLAATAVAGLMVWDTDLNKFFFFNGVSWDEGSTGGLWTKNGSGYAYLTNLSGRVGIGTQYPTYQIDIYNDSGPAWIKTKSADNWAGLMIEKGMKTGNGYIIFSTSGVSKWFAGTINSNNFSISTKFNGTGDEFFIDTTGRVGIGTNTPQRTLEVKGGERTARINSSTNAAYLEFLGTNATDWAIGTEIGSMRMQSSADGFATSTDRYIFSNNFFHPYSNNVRSLGLSSFRWSNLYSVDGDFSGSVNVTGNTYVGDTLGVGTTNPARTFEVKGGERTARLTSSTSGGYLEFVTTNATDWAIGTNIGTMRIQSSTDGFVTSTDRYIFSSGFFHPYSNNVRTLGMSTYRWSTLYTVNGDFSGNVGIGIATPARPLEVRGPFKTARISSTQGGATLEFVSTSQNDWAVGIWNGSFILLNSTDDFASKTDEYYFTTTSIYPYTTNTKSLGTSSKRWSNLYSIAGNFNGAGSGIAGATVYSVNTGTSGIAGYFETTGTDATMVMEQNGTGKFLKAFGPNGGNEELSIDNDGTISIYNSSYTRTILIDPSESGTTDGGQITMYNAAGTATIEIDGSYGGDGRITTQELQITGGSDLSEFFDLTAYEDIQKGMVVSIDENNPGHLVVSKDAYDKKVAGIISGANNIEPGLIMSQKGTIADGEHLVALSGRVYCMVDASSNPVMIGDMLTTSSEPGHAMKVDDFEKARGAIIGKAMTSLESGKGLVLVLVSLQ